MEEGEDFLECGVVVGADAFGFAIGTGVAVKLGLTERTCGGAEERQGVFFGYGALHVLECVEEVREGELRKELSVGVCPIEFCGFGRKKGSLEEHEGVECGDELFLRHGRSSSTSSLRIAEAKPSMRRRSS